MSIKLKLFGGTAGGSVRSSARAFLAASAQGAGIATLSKPFGTTTVFSAVGSVPGQLALSSGAIVRGASAAVGGNSYTVTIRAANAAGTKAVETTLTFAAIAGVVISGAPVDAIVGAPYSHVFTATGAIALDATDLAALAAHNITFDAATRTLSSSGVTA